MGINLQMDYIREFMADLDARSQLRSARELAMSEGRADTARNLKKLGVKDAIICQATGLTPEEVAGLDKQTQ